MQIIFEFLQTYFAEIGMAVSSLFTFWKFVIDKPKREKEQIENLHSIKEKLLIQFSTEIRLSEELSYEKRLNSFFKNKCPECFQQAEAQMNQNYE